MPLDVPDGERCFLDANILYYCYVETPPPGMTKGQKRFSAEKYTVAEMMNCDK